MTYPFASNSTPQASLNRNERLGSNPGIPKQMGHFTGDQPNKAGRREAQVAASLQTKEARALARFLYDVYRRRKMQEYISNRAREHE